MCLWEFGAGNLKETGRFYQERWIWGNSLSGDIGKVKNVRNLSHVPPKHLSFTHCEGARLHCHEWGAELIMYFLQRAHNQIILSKLSVGVKVNVNGVVSVCDPVMDRWTVQGLPPLGLTDFQSTCCGQVDLIQGWSYLYSDEVTFPAALDPHLDWTMVSGTSVKYMTGCVQKKACNKWCSRTTNQQMPKTQSSFDTNSSAQ